jgi:hypothetical protein
MVRSDGSTRWSGLGLTLKLPPGAWRIERRGENAVLFRPESGPGDLLIERVKTRPKEPEWLALKKLLSSFDVKKEVLQRAERLPDGESALRAEFDVQVKAARVRLTVYLVPRAGWIYEVSEWNFGGGAPAEDFLAGLAPAAEPGPASPGQSPTPRAP